MLLERFTHKIKDYSYDPRNDILYIHFSRMTEDQYAEELDDGFYEIRSTDTDEVKGLMILYARSQTDQQIESLEKYGYGDIDIWDMLIT